MVDTVSFLIFLLTSATQMYAVEFLIPEAIFIYGQPIIQVVISPAMMYSLDKKRKEHA